MEEKNEKRYYQFHKPQNNTELCKKQAGLKNMSISQFFPECSSATSFWTSISQRESNAEDTIAKKN